MNDSRFNEWDTTLAAFTTRRAALGAAAAAASAAMLSAVGLDTEAKKKKKKCKKPKVKCGKTCCPKGQKCLAGQCAVPCNFVTSGSVMTLQANCTLTSTIEISDGVTLDGDGKTIRLAGANGRIVNEPGAAEVKIHNLTIDGAATSRACDLSVEAPIRLFTSDGGEIRNVTIANIGCIPAIIAGGSGLGTPHLDVIDTTVANAATSGDGAISLVTPMEASISNCTFRDIPEGFGVRAAFGAITVSVADSTFEDVVLGVEVSEASTFTITGNQMRGVMAGAITTGAGANTMVVTNNTIVGPGSSGGTGVIFGDNATGTVAGNTISNFLGAGSCGIEIDADAGPVTIGANTFPDPPGNEQDVCDFS